MAPKASKRKAQPCEGPAKGPLTGKMISCDRKILPKTFTRALPSSVRDVKSEIGNLLKPKSRTYICHGLEGASGLTTSVSSKVLGKLLDAPKAAGGRSAPQESSKGNAYP
jgi:hypothetical protein